MSTQQCNHCRFWREDMGRRDPNDENFGFGNCHLKPPVIVDSLIAVQIQRPIYGQVTDLAPDATEVVNASLFPATFATDWCGELVAKEER